MGHLDLSFNSLTLRSPLPPPYVLLSTPVDSVLASHTCFPTHNAVSPILQPLVLFSALIGIFKVLVSLGSQACY